MAGERELVGLLYRADSSRLSLTADFHGMVDLSARFDMTNQGVGPWSPPSAGESPAGIRVVSERLVIAPGGRYRFEEPGDAEQVSWPVHPGLLLHPRDLLEFTLSVRGAVVVAGRDALDVVATPGPWRKGYAKPLERILAAVDAETGILLRREGIFEGKTVQLAEFTRVSFEMAEAAGAFASRPGSLWCGASSATSLPGRTTMPSCWIFHLASRSCGMTAACSTRSTCRSRYGRRRKPPGPRHGRRRDSSTRRAAPARA